MQRFRGTYISIVFPLVGLLFCIWNKVDPSSVPCDSLGCTLYHYGGSNGGVWWFGIIGFFTLSLCALGGRYYLGYLLSSIGLWIDCIFLGIMVLTLPCFVCLITAMLLALSCRIFFAMGRPFPLGVRVSGLRCSILFMVWFLLFFGNCVLLVKEKVSPWPLLGDPDREASVFVYFSPSCSACQDLIDVFPLSSMKDSVWFPVIEQSEDIGVIKALKNILIDNEIPIKEALAIAKRSSGWSWFEMLDPSNMLLYFRLVVNSSYVLQNKGVLPFLEFRGVPKALLVKNRSTMHPECSGEKEDIEFLDIQTFGMCKGKKNSKGECLD